MRARIMVLTLLAWACDDGGETVESGRLQVIGGELGEVDQIRLLVRVEGGDDAGMSASETKESTVSLNDGLLVDRAIVISGNLLPAGDGRITVHAVALSNGEVVGVGDGSALPDENKTITVVSVPADCDADGDTWLDCQNLRAGCCAEVAPEDKDRATDCVDDPNIDPPAIPDLKRRVASDAHPFGQESSDDYFLCQNGVDEDCSGSDVRCDEVDEDDDGSPLAEDCDDNDPETFPGAVDGPDPEDRNCDGDPGGVEGVDADQDGFAEDVDCDDDDPRRNPGAVEVPCNDIDEDCDGNDPCAMGDLDGDGFAVPEDCDGFDSGVFPGAPEECGDGIDQDCDGEDLACPEGDIDGDGFAADDCDDDDPRRYPGAPEKCGDGVDQDCDGRDLDCPPGADADGDGFLDPADCDNDDRRVFPGAPELCNRRDDDCDGIVDEGNPLIAANGVDRVPPTCSVDEGLCTSGPNVCTANPDSPDSAMFQCLGVIGTDERCDGLDNDCNGDIDDPPGGAAILPDEGQQSCGPEQMRGVCQQGTLFCNDGQLNDCRGAVEPSEEDCNNLDDDCDGRTDEGPAGGVLNQACFDGPEGGAAQGICQPGVRTCEDGQFSACLSQILPEEEGCNGLDDDCDGTVDEIEPIGCYNFPPETEGVGVCRGGQRLCVDGELGPCDGQVGPTEELCDALDNDCDGRVDQVQQACFSGQPEQIDVGICRAGVGTCRNGEFSECVGERPPVAELCDQLDNDCDGSVDEAFDLAVDRTNCGVCGRSCGAGEECCAGACRPLDTPQNCGACGEVCGDEADRCNPGNPASCGCGDGPACDGGLRCLGDGTCVCEQDLDCGENQLCCDNLCIDTRLNRCTRCQGGACDPATANACGGRRCLCGDTGACPAGTQCAERNGGFACVGCVDNSACPDDSICCGQVCVPARPDTQCTDCGVGCDLDTANQCNAAGANRVCGCGDGAACAGGQVCVTDAGPDAFCAQCRDNNDCGGGTPFCLDNVCRACNPDGHVGCGANQLCCDFTCQGTGVGNRACEACDVQCDEVTADRCTNRGCRCGNAEPCAGGTPYCVGASCEQCRNDNDCGGATPFCAGGSCVACRVGDQAGCAADQLCCANRGAPQCQSTNANPGGQCEACDESCTDGTANQCRNRGCACGQGDACDPDGDTPVCAGDRCVECQDNNDCNGRPGSFCIDNVCEDCNPQGHAGCGANQLCCGGQGGLACVGTAPNANCEGCGQRCNDDVADSCVNRGCQCGGNDPCEGGEFCVAGQCRECRDEVDCGADQLCCAGVCTDQGFGGGAICEACGESCNERTSDTCDDGNCRCGGDPPCAGDTPICIGGSCVECEQDAECPAEEPICDGNACRECMGAECGGCVDDDDCAEDDAGKFCVDTRCVPCVSSGDGCDFNGGLPICRESVCQACLNDGECDARREAAVADCDGNGPCETQVRRRDICITSGALVGQCWECNPETNVGCGGRRPICQDTHLCRSCQDDQECIDLELGDTCNRGNGRCQ